MVQEGDFQMFLCKRLNMPIGKRVKGWEYVWNFGEEENLANYILILLITILVVAQAVLQITFSLIENLSQSVNQW